MKFAGVDLAWKKGESGVAVISEGRAEVLFIEEIEEIAEFLSKLGEVFVGVDAPLVIKNLRGYRHADAELNRAFSAFSLRCLPVSWQIMHKLYSGARGVELAEALVARGFRLNPELKRPQRGRAVAEVFPHASAIVLFGLKSPLKYKAGRRRSVKQRREELLRYRELVHKLKYKTPSLEIPEVEIGYKGRELKRAEDTLDAILCAYTVYHTWWHGRAKIFGNPRGEHILVPEVVA